MQLLVQPFSTYAGLLDAAPIEAAIIAAVAGFKFVGIGKALGTALKSALFGGITLEGLKLLFSGYTIGFVGGPVLMLLEMKSLIR